MPVETKGREQEAWLKIMRGAGSTKMQKEREQWKIVTRLEFLIAAQRAQVHLCNFFKHLLPTLSKSYAATKSDMSL